MTKRYTLLLVLICILLLGAVFVVYKNLISKPKEKLSMEQNLQNKKILMIVAFKDFKDEEYFVPREVLEKGGAEITIASTQKGVALGVSGGEVNVDLELNEVAVDDFDAIVFIGGPGAHDYIENSECHRIAKQAVEKNKVLGAICIAPAILARAGILQGKKATVWSSVIDKSTVKILKESGAIYQDSNVVVDGKIITANGPQAAEEFGRKLVQVLTSNL